MDRTFQQTSVWVWFAIDKASCVCGLKLPKDVVGVVRLLEKQKGAVDQL